jgi:hypothetical protein
MAITSANQLELLQTADAVAREKMIDPALVIEAMEESLARAAKSRYGSEMDIRVKIDRKTGRASFTRRSEGGRRDRGRGAARRPRPHRRAVGQAGDPAKGARG